MLLMIDGPMINRFLNDVDNFHQISDERFRELDGNGLLSMKDLGRKLSESVGLDHNTMSDRQFEDGKDKEIDNLFFDKFDVDGNGSIDREKFRLMMRAILDALAFGIGSTPVIVGVDEDSLLMKAYENELARVDFKLDEAIVSNGIEIIGRGRNSKKRKTVETMCAIRVKLDVAKTKPCESLENPKKYCSINQF